MKLIRYSFLWNNKDVLTKECPYKSDGTCVYSAHCVGCKFFKGKIKGQLLIQCALDEVIPEFQNINHNILLIEKKYIMHDEA